MSKFKLGEVLKDKVTGFQGVVMGRTEYFTQCAHYGLCSQTLKDGKPLEWEWIDETRLVRVEGAERVLQESREPTSGPHPNAPQM
ncbi:MAG: hypothetical protein V1844_09825 [Pseudomonadota bacterium]